MFSPDSASLGNWGVKRYMEAMCVESRIYRSFRRSKGNLCPPRNHDLTLSCAQLFSRLAGRHKSILNITFNMIKKVTETAPERAKYLTELGYQHMMQGELSKAEQTFHSAVAKDETDVRALFGIINCRVQEGSLDDAAWCGTLSDFLGGMTRR